MLKNLDFWTLFSRNFVLLQRRNAKSTRPTEALQRRKKKSVDVKRLNAYCRTISNDSKRLNAYCRTISGRFFRRLNGLKHKKGRKKKTNFWIHRKWGHSRQDGAREPCAHFPDDARSTRQTPSNQILIRRHG